MQHGYNRKNQTLISYSDNISSAIHLVPHEPNMPVPLSPTDLQKFLNISEAKLTKGIFVGPDVRKFMKDDEFQA
ncbi:hypothetical protein TNCV_1952801 [Trichonephila clavipes]|nr:hypothetical protein TNCV_1952801 [Trichonephila clavipes]